jgi:hypothetical protein
MPATAPQLRPRHGGRAGSRRDGLHRDPPDRRHLGRNDDAEVVVFTGDTTLENLPLDFSHLDSWSGLMKTHPGMFLGVVVDGDLTVTDWITNWEWDFGPFLLVRGNVRAKNFATAGSEVPIEGNLKVTQTVAGIYNHGRTVIKGDTSAEVVLTAEHLTEFHGRLTAELGIAGNFLRVADPAKVQVNGWAGYVCDLQGQILPSLGSRSTRRPETPRSIFCTLQEQSRVDGRRAESASPIGGHRARQPQLTQPDRLPRTPRALLRVSTEIRRSVLVAGVRRCHASRYRSSQPAVRSSYPMSA